MAAPPEAYQQRRAQLAAELQRPLIICAGHAPARNYPANAHPFRPASSYRYFGGPPLEHAAWFIEPGSDGRGGCTLLRPRITADDVVWIGEPASDEELANAAGIGTSQIVDLERTKHVLRDQQAGCISAPFPSTLDWIAKHQLDAATDEELRIVIDLRLRKDDHERNAMRRAAEISIEAHYAALAATSPGRREADVAAAFHAVLVANQSVPSFNPIISIHGEVLHCIGYPNVLPEGKLLLVDAGAEEPTGYASDITRTYPISGRWTPIQRALYDVVLHAQNEATAACVPGRRYRDVHDLAARIICTGLVNTELLRGDPDELAERRAHTLFFPHGVGHLIGMDVHDMEDFGDLAGYAPGRQRRGGFGDIALRLDRDLEPGHCVTIEPGIYFIPAIWRRDDLLEPFQDVINRKNIDALLEDAFGGIRIEHTICVSDESAGGPEILTRALPTEADEIAELVGGG